ncbi:MAG: aminoacyl-tRNA hydrolase [Chloroflexota bacterium]
MEQGKALIVGLGNPGPTHKHDRHNLGFMTVDRLAAVHGLSLGRVQNKAIVGAGLLAGRPVVLAKPQTYMNLSGESVSALARFYKIPPADVLVIYDEIDLPLGTLRLRSKGGSGGHNGMRSIIQHLGEEFPRLRLGVGRPPGRMAPADYVLQPFGREELPIVAELLDQAVTAIETFLREGLDLAMTRHNRVMSDE